MTNHTQHRAPAARHARGFVVVAVLILLALMATIGLTWLRHVSLSERGSPVNRHNVEAREALVTGVEVARQAREAGQDTGSLTVDADGRTAQVLVDDLDEDHVRWNASVVDSEGLGGTIALESGRLAVPTDEPLDGPDKLPRVQPTVAALLLDDDSVPKLVYSGSTSLSNTELTGLVVLQPGAELMLDDVVIQGAVVSAAALSELDIGDYDEDDAPTLIIDGNLRIDPGDFLPGVAVVLPDGMVRTWYSEGTIQLGGAVVAHTVQLDLPGAITGPVASVDLTISEEIDRPGHGLLPEELPDDLDPRGAWEDEYLAVVPRVQTIDDLQAITGYWDEH